MTATASETLEVGGPSVSAVEWAPVARVNLLPREITEGRKFRRVQQGLAGVVVVTVALSGAAFWWSQQRVTDARESLQAVQATTTQLQARERSFAEVPATTAQVDAAIDARAWVMATDVPWYRYLTDLEAAAPKGVTFESLTVKVSGPTAAGPGAAAAPATPGTEAAANPFAPTNGIGTLALNGISGSYPQVADWMEALDKVAGLDVTELSNASGRSDAPEGEQTINFASGITITDQALSHRFDRKAS
jgi:Tfp pilus assembly protein PilN